MIGMPAPRPVQGVIYCVVLMLYWIKKYIFYPIQ